VRMTNLGVFYLPTWETWIPSALVLSLNCGRRGKPVLGRTMT
jgi:hypothetical protein